MAPPRSSRHDWWRFLDADPAAPATGTFRAEAPESVGRLYLPLVNEAGALSWTSPALHGGLAAGHHAYLTLPLTAEDLPHTLAHRGFWVLDPRGRPIALSPLAPDGLAGLGRPGTRAASTLDAGLGWCTITRRSPDGRFSLCATLWCPADVPAAVEVMQVDAVNHSKHPLRLTPYAAIPVFGRSADNVRDHRHVTALLHRLERTPHGLTVCPTMSFDERGHRPNRTRYSVLAFGPRGSRPAALWTTEQAFLGDGGTFAAPAAVWQARRKAPPFRSDPGREVLAGFRFAPVTIPAGGRARWWLLSGISTDPEAMSRWRRWGRSEATLTRSLEQTKRFWLAKTQRVSFFTAERRLDQWLAWVGFQPMLRRLYGNSYLPQFDYGRGGRGWRDLWQDCLALLLSDPASVRPTLLHNLGGIRIDGSNATIIGTDGAFIADRNNIPRTWMDHGAWPLYTTLFYLDQTGDTDFLLEQCEYFRDPQRFRCRQRDPGWTSRDGLQLRTRAGRLWRGSVLEHLLVQTVTAFFNVGEHNVCRLEGADWNDGLDMAAERGESVAFSAFYAWNLQRLADACRRLAARGRDAVDLPKELLLLLDRLPRCRPVRYASPAAKQARMERYLEAVSGDLSGTTVRVRLTDLAEDLLAKHADLAGRIRRQEWVRAGRYGFFNGYYDNRGRRVEGPHPRGVRMTLPGQVFALMSGIATEQQVDRTADAVERLLRDPRHGGIRLNTNFREPQPSLGRGFSFAYGEKENGAVFSHMAVMYAYALYARRRPTAGRQAWMALYRMAVHQPVAKIFPCLPEYFNADGRGLYAYLTGSASWFVYLLLTRVYGVRGSQGDLVLDPQLTREDFGARSNVSVRVRFAGRSLRVCFRNPTRLPEGRYRVAAVTVAGRPLPFVLHPDGGVRIARREIARLRSRGEHAVDVTLGRAR